VEAYSPSCCPRTRAFLLRARAPGRRAEQRLAYLGMSPWRAPDDDTIRVPSGERGSCTPTATSISLTMVRCSLDSERPPHESRSQPDTKSPTRPLRRLKASSTRTSARARKSKSRARARLRKTVRCEVWATSDTEPGLRRTIHRCNRRGWGCGEGSSVRASLVYSAVFDISRSDLDYHPEGGN
jgi:hypothetical protein